MSMVERRRAWIALCLPVLAMFVAALVSRISGYVVGHTLVGMIGTALGGVTAGVTTWRYLIRWQSDGEMFFGLGAVSAIGVVAVGFVYLFYIDHRFAAIGTPERAIAQLFIFVEFVSAQYAGICWARRFFPKMAAVEEGKEKR